MQKRHCRIVRHLLEDAILAGGVHVDIVGGGISTGAEWFVKAPDQHMFNDAAAKEQQGVEHVVDQRVHHDRVFGLLQNLELESEEVKTWWKGTLHLSR